MHEIRLCKELNINVRYTSPTTWQIAAETRLIATIICAKACRAAAIGHARFCRATRGWRVAAKARRASRIWRIAAKTCWPACARI